MNLRLIHGDDESAVVVDSTVISYRRKIHRYESASDFALIKTELLTYGRSAAQAVVDHLTARRRG